MKLVLAKWTADRIPAGNLPEWSAQEAMNYLKQRLNGHGGIIVLDPEGHIGIAHNTPRMAWAFKTVNKEEAGVVKENAMLSSDYLSDYFKADARSGMLQPTLGSRDPRRFHAIAGAQSC